MVKELFFKVKELLFKQDIEKLNLFAAILAINGEQIIASKDRKDLKCIIIKVLEGKLDEEGQADEEKCDIFKYMIQDLMLYNRDHEKAQADQKEDVKKNAIGADNSADNDCQDNNFLPTLRELNLRQTRRIS